MGRLGFGWGDTGSSPGRLGHRDEGRVWDCGDLLAGPQIDAADWLHRPMAEALFSPQTASVFFSAAAKPVETAQ
jgi:hypothetical protein